MDHTPGTPPCREGFHDCPYLSCWRDRMWCGHPYEPIMLNYMEEDNPKMYQEVLEECVIPIEMKEACPAESEIIAYIRAMEEEE